MTRWLPLVFVAFALDAQASPARLDPNTLTPCRPAPWDVVEKCLRQYGKVTEVRTMKGVRLVGVRRSLDGKTIVDADAYLFIEREGVWVLRWRYTARGRGFEVLDLQTVSAGLLAGFRIDIGESYRVPVELPDGTTTTGMINARHAEICNDEVFSCTEILVGCDVLVRGRSWFTFHGTLEINGMILNVRGDRSHTGPTSHACFSVPVATLPW